MTRPYRLTAIETLLILGVLLWSRSYSGPMGVVLGLLLAWWLLQLEAWAARDSH